MSKIKVRNKSKKNVLFTFSFPTWLEVPLFDGNFPCKVRQHSFFMKLSAACVMHRNLAD